MATPHFGSGGSGAGCVCTGLLGGTRWPWQPRVGTGAVGGCEGIKAAVLADCRTCVMCLEGQQGEELAARCLEAADVGTACWGPFDAPNMPQPPSPCRPRGLIREDPR